MARTNSVRDEIIDDDSALAKWQGERAAARQDYEKIINRRENELLDASGRVGPKSRAFINNDKDLHNAENMRSGIQGVLERPLNKYHMRWRYFAAFAVVLALLEAPVNKFLFDVALQSIGFFSFLASVILALCLLILAHLAGKSIRQVYSEYRRKIVWSSLLISLLIVFMLVTVIGILTVGRALTSVTAIASFRDMFAAVTTTVAEQGFWRAIRTAFGDLSALILATVNIGGIFAAMMLAYFTHDPDKDYDAANDAVERYRNTRNRLEKKYAKAKAAIIRKYETSLVVASTHFKDATKHVIELKRRLGRPLDEEDDHLLIDKLDTLAEKSGLNDNPARRSDGRTAVDRDSVVSVSARRPA